MFDRKPSARPKINTTADEAIRASPLITSVEGTAVTMGCLALLFPLLVANQYLPFVQWNTDDPWVNVVSGSF